MAVSILFQLFWDGSTWWAEKSFPWPFPWLPPVDSEVKLSNSETEDLFRVTGEYQLFPDEAYVAVAIDVVYLPRITRLVREEEWGLSGDIAQYHKDVTEHGS